MTVLQSSSTEAACEMPSQCTCCHWNIFMLACSSVAKHRSAWQLYRKLRSLTTCLLTHLTIFQRDETTDGWILIRFFYSDVSAQRPPLMSWSSWQWLLLSTSTVTCQQTQSMRLIWYTMPKRSGRKKDVPQFYEHLLRFIAPLWCFFIAPVIYTIINVFWSIFNRTHRIYWAHVHVEI